MMVRRVLILAALGAAMTGCGGSRDHGATSLDSRVLTTLAVTLSAPTVYTGSTVMASAAGTDQHGVSIATGTVAWSTDDPAVAAVSNTGMVTALAAGTTSVVATIGAKHGQATLVVRQLPVARVALVPDSALIIRGATQQFTAATLDSNGDVLTGRGVTWGSSDSAIATVDSTGLVTGVAVGNATISATSEGQTGVAAIGVAAPPPPGMAPTILSISPATLTPGVTMTINGTGFSTSKSSNMVTIDGATAIVTSAASTRLTATVPGSLPCLPTHGATVAVLVGGQSVTHLQALRTGTVESVAVGQALVITSSTALACLELPQADGGYVVSVFNDLQVPTSIAAFRMVGGSVAAVSNRVSPLTLRQAITRPATSPSLPTDLRGAPQDPAMHLRVLEASRAAYATLRGPRSTGPSMARAVAGQPAFATIPSVGATRTFRVNQFSTTVQSTGSCRSYKEITARAVFVGTRSILWEDEAAPLAGAMDGYFARLGHEFDSTMYRSDSAYFGDPLVTDAYTDGDHHVDMVFTPSVPSGLAGFVVSCDLFARDSVNDPSSNFGEFFYAVVPTVAGTGYNGNTADAWLRNIRTTVVHEVKHIASMGARLTNNASTFEESWLEEGMAREAESVWLRDHLYHAPWKGEATYAATVFCDVRPTYSPCGDAAYGVFSHFLTLYTVLRNPGASSLFGRVTDNDFNFYALAWSFSRWVDDRYAISDTAFLRGITQATSTSGMTTIAALTGQSVDQLMGHWVLSLDVDGLSAFAANPDVQFPTWDTRDIYAGMAADFPSFFPRQFPLTPLKLTGGDFAVDNAGIHGGAFAMYDVTTTASMGQTIALRGAGGSGPPGFSLRIAIARKQ
jgi:Bacterial Ig-like domain (group 2)/IPT/TIG domain